jgi:hypothetical protein
VIFTYECAFYFTRFSRKLHPSNNNEQRPQQLATMMAVLLTMTTDASIQGDFNRVGFIRLVGRSKFSCFVFHLLRRVADARLFFTDTHFLEGECLLVVDDTMIRVILI